MLGSGVAGATGIGLEPGNRAHIDDVTLARRPQSGKESARHAGYSQKVDFPHGAPAVFGRFLDRIETESAAGVVDQQIHSVDIGHELFDTVGVRDIQAQSSRSDRVGELLQTLEPAGTDHDREPGLG